MRQLYMVNLPYNCMEFELKKWVESRGVHVRDLRIIRDLLTGMSPCFACIEIEESSKMRKAIDALNGQSLRGQRIAVSEADVATPGSVCGAERKIA
jgi:RNA recognition motif-containing protein